MRLASAWLVTLLLQLKVPVDQLDVGGRLVIPIGDRALQDLTIFERMEQGMRTTRAGPCRFVPLLSREAFHEGW